MVTKNINYSKIEDWICKYNNCSSEKQKKQILTLIFIACKPLVESIAYGLARRSSDPVEDIIQVGNVGLIKAVQRYKIEYKSLKTYIKYSIIGEIKHYLRDKTESVRPPRVILELAYRINKLTIEKIEKDGIKYSKEMLAKNLNVSPEKIQEAFEYERRQPVSFEQVIFQNDDFTKKIEDEILDEKSYIEIDKIALNSAIEKLPEKLSNVIKHLYFDGMSQSDLAKEMKTSQSHISRMQKRALNMLFDIITKENNE